jgi:1-aminocyclopropane-1-carboxylate deaminase/D-cysteine desulfhydrase-like pyridoxal-dependent ACC family enzyme
MIECAVAKLRALPRLELGAFPTPLNGMPRLRAALGAAPRLWIKHDDWSGPGFGGNKVRKLEYVLARAFELRCDTVLTTGGLRSNHARVTAALAARLGLECHLILNRPAQPYAYHPASLWADEMYGATIHTVARPAERAPAMAALAEELRRAGRRPLEIPLGASTPIGALGFVRAAGELREQCQALGVRPACIFHSTSSAGTQAGLAAGCRLFGLETRVQGISADDPVAAIAGAAASIIAGLEPLLGADLAAPLDVDDGFTGDGYGIPSAAGEEALRLLTRTEGVTLDPVYTAKAMAGMLAALRAGRFGRNDDVVFWHTGGQLALFAATEPA